MRIEIQTTDLLRQVPERMRRVFADVDDLPRSFVFEIAGAYQDKRDELKKEHPVIRQLLTPVEWAIFCDLISIPDGASIQVLARHLFSHKTSAAMYANTVAVHVKSMRKKLSKTRYEIKNDRGNRYHPGRYRIEYRYALLGDKPRQRGMVTFGEMDPALKEENL